MAKKKVEIWVAEKPFDFQGEHYEPGDEWSPPPGYEYDEAYTEMWNRGPAFAYQYLAGREGKKEVYTTHHMILPVSLKE